MGEKFRQLKYKDRLKIEDLYKEKHSVQDIANRLGVTRQTIYNELKRGMYTRIVGADWKDKEFYSADIAQKDYEEKTSLRGTGLKIGNDIKLANYIEEKIINEKYSPEAVVGEIKEKKLEFETTICVRTLYNYIDSGNVFFNLTNRDLPVKAERKREYKRVRQKERKRKFGKNIEERPKSVDTREEFGNWEMDTVVGPRGKSKCSMLVLTERKTRKEIVRLLPSHTAAEVVKAINEIEKQCGEMFSKIFKTITVDNGSEFSMYEELQKSSIEENQNRTSIYYCHPYSSYERGSNEVANKLIRRHIKKATNFDDKTQEEIQYIEDWINNYPRGIFEFKTANDMFNLEIQQLLNAG